MSKLIINSEDDFEKIEREDLLDKEGDDHTIKEEDHTIESETEGKKEKIIQIGKEDKEIVIVMKEEIPEGEPDFDIYKELEEMGKELKETMIDMKNEIKKGFSGLLLYLSTFEVKEEKLEV